jgi:hypothetical protein
LRFHIVALPHTQVTKEFAGCAFTEKVRRFCIMMNDLGHEVYLYEGETVEAPVTELITCVADSKRAQAVAGAISPKAFAALKASARAKLAAGTPLTEAEAATLVI